METPLVELNDEWVTHLLSIAACRRLSGDEARHILLGITLPGASTPLKRLVIDAPPSVENGTIVLVRKGLIKCVKKDGGNWTKRPNGNKVREDHAKITCTKKTSYSAINIPTVLNCYISRMDDSNRTSGKGMLYRRRYVMVGSSFQLIHYLSDQEATDAAALAVAASPSIGSPLQLPLVLGKGDEMVGFEGLEPITTLAAANRQWDNIGVNSQREKSTPLSDTTTLLITLDKDLASFLNLGEISPPPEITVLDISPAWDFTFGGAKVLICLSHSLALDAFPCEGAERTGISILFGSKNAVTCDILTGGQVLRCYSPPSYLESGVGRVPLKIRIGCTDISPRGEPSIWFEYRSAADFAFGMAHHLTYTKPFSNSPFQKHNKRQQGEDSRITKIRVVERLGEFAQSTNQVFTSLGDSQKGLSHLHTLKKTVNNGSQNEKGQGGVQLGSSGDSCNSFMRSDSVLEMNPSSQSSFSTDGKRLVHLTGESFDDILDDSALSELDNSQLEGILDQLVVRVIDQLAQLAATCGNLSGELGKQDSIGYALLHYASICGNLQLVPRLIACGADPMQCTGDDGHQTPLHLAAAAGNIEISLQLLEAGARPNFRDGEGLTPSDVAFRMGYKDIGQWLGNLQQVVELQHGSPTSGTAHVPYSKYVDEQVIPGECTPSLPPSASPLNPSSIMKPPPSSQLLFPKHSPEQNTSSVNLKTSKLLQNAFSSLSLHEKCAVCLSLLPKKSENCFTPAGKHRCGGSEILQEVFSEKERKNLNVAMSAMRTDELGNLEKQARIIQQNVRAWALRRNYINMRNAVMTLQMFWRNRRSGRAQRGGLHQARLQLERDEVLPQGERNTVYINDTHDQSLDFEDMGGGDQSTTSFHRSNLSQHVAASTQLQAAARGMLTRRQFTRLKSEATTLLKLRHTDPRPTTLHNIPS